MLGSNSNIGFNFSQKFPVKIKNGNKVVAVYNSVSWKKDLIDDWRKFKNLKKKEDFITFFRVLKINALT